MERSDDMRKEKITGWFCVTQLEHNNEESAWKEYIIQFEHVCTWLRGFKYWRVEPHLEHGSQMWPENNKKMFHVYSRLVLSKDEIKSSEIKPANFIYEGKEYKWNDYN